MTWRNATQDPPEFKYPVLALCGNGQCVVAVYRDEWLIALNMTCPEYPVTHWQYLPPLPKERLRKAL